MSKTKNIFAKLRGLSLSAVLVAQNASGINNPYFNSIGKKFFGTQQAGSPTAAGSIGELIVYAINILLLLAGSAAVIYIVVGGYRYVMAHGNEEQTEAAKKTLTSAILGLVIIVLAFAVVTIIATVLLQPPGSGTGIGTGEPPVDTKVKL